MKRVDGCRLTVVLILLSTVNCQPSTHKQHLEFWSLGREGEVVAELIPEFERRNPGIDVVIQQIPWTAAHEKLLTAHVGNATPDVAQIGNTWIPEMVAMNALDELAPPIVDRRDYFDGVWATNEVDGKLYGIPWYVDTRVLFYRKDLLTAPRTWSEWLATMDRLKREKKSRYGILMPINEFEPIFALALTNGSTLLDPSGTRGAFEERPFAEAFAFYHECFKRGFAPTISNVQVANLYQQFAAGDFAMYITGPWNVGEFKRRIPPEQQNIWATAPLPARDASTPTGISMAGGSSLVIYRASKQKEAARKLIAFLSEREQQIRFYELSGDLPARRSAWTAPALANDPYFPAFREQLERVAPMPRVPEWEQIATLVFNYGEATARGAMTEKAALAELDQKANELLEKRRWMKRGQLSVISDRGVAP